MTNLLQDGATWLADKLQSAAGRSVVYRRGSSYSDAIVATPVMHEYRVIEESGLAADVVAYDWVFTRTDLVITGRSITPRPGDRITETINGRSEEYEVVPIGDTPCVEDMDSSGIMIKVHTAKL